LTVLVTGADGFVGRWLVEHLRREGDDVVTACGQDLGTDDCTTRIDIRDPADAQRVVDWARPASIYHLAAVAFGPDAQRNPTDALDVTVGGTLNLLRAAARLGNPPTVFIPSSGEVYGRPTTTRVLTEEDPIAPVSAYGSAKAAQELVALACHHAGALPVVVARAFNHIGPGQRDAFVVASFASQLAAIALGRHEPRLRVGNLLPERDFTDVRDVVAAYRLLVVGGHAGTVFNVASGAGVSIGLLLDRLVELSGVEATIEVDQDRVRQVDPPHIVGDASRLRAATGWRPRHSLDQTLRDVWEDALARASVA
jgi:GDP-4-dehydro-6-deoxy-D-mannose reductase